MCGVQPVRRRLGDAGEAPPTGSFGRARGTAPADRAGPAPRCWARAGPATGQLCRRRRLLQHDRGRALPPQLAGHHHAGRSAAGNDHLKHEPPCNKVASRPAPSAQSGGAHTPISAARARNRSASSTGGSRSRQTHVDTSARTSPIPDFRRFWLRPEIVHHDPGLAPSPRSGKERVTPCLFLCRPLWTDNLLTKRQRAAYGDGGGPGGSPTGLRMQPQNERFLALFQPGRLERRRERRHSHGVRRRAVRPEAWAW
jgi:hypothetical protein